MVMIRATIAKNAKRKAKHKSTLGELPKHDHELPYWIWAVSFQYKTGTYQIPLQDKGNAIEYANGKANQKQIVTAVGNDEYHNNITPAISCYAWRRQA